MRGVQSLETMDLRRRGGANAIAEMLELILHISDTERCESASRLAVGNVTGRSPAPGRLAWFSYVPLGLGLCQYIIFSMTRSFLGIVILLLLELKLKVID